MLLLAIVFGTLDSNGKTTSLSLPTCLPGDWITIGRIQIHTRSDSAVVSGGYVLNNQIHTNAEVVFQARAPLGTEQVQIWAGFRCHDRASRYVFALRGGNDNDVYLARYAPDGGSKFLEFAPLDFKPMPGIWYTLRAVFFGNRIQIYLGNEQLPRINVKDDDANWNDGGIALGGGWLPTEFSKLSIKNLTETDQAALRGLGDAQWRPAHLDKKALRRTQRAAYAPAVFPAFNPIRTDLSLTGEWLFEPDYELRAGEIPVQLDYNDRNWHVMPVPSFWTPGLSWLHGETGFMAANEFSSTKGVADSLTVQEIQRCDGYTFDWRKTHAAWYRHYFNLPSDFNDRHFELCFDAIAKVSEIWVNGIQVGSHVGMFGQIKCDVTKAVRPGTNVIAVQVTARRNSDASSNAVAGVAVTVEVTSSMLHSLPHGMFQDEVGGIWQPVRLTATSPLRVSECFIEPSLQSADLNLEIPNDSGLSASVDVSYTIIAIGNSSLLYSNSDARTVAIASRDTGHVQIKTPVLNPKPWSPQDPNLYRLDVYLKQEGMEIDHYQTTFGFRTFRVRGEQLFLNGKPFRLRGANPFPNTLRPNDPILAQKFMEIARAGNVTMTRSHIVPFTSTWLDAADRTGMAISFEGTWPWLMLEGDPPGNKLIKLWRDEFISLIHEYYNHPSILLWTVNNEMKFEELDQKNTNLLQRKWHILDEAVREIRTADPTRPIVADSSYSRTAAQKSYLAVVMPRGLDDGDLDDVHHYYGWYNESFFHFYDGEYAKQAFPGRPLISQEMSTGYPNNDDGHPVRYYLFKHSTPQALVGDDAYENADPTFFLTRQAFMTKELAEALRRTAKNGEAGNLYFSYLTWFQMPWSTAHIKPWPAYYALQTALQPVLVSAELYGRHFYADSTVRLRVCLVNDSEKGQPIACGKLFWAFKAGDQVLSSGQTDFPEVDYCHNYWQMVDFKLPSVLPEPRTDAQLELRFVSKGITISTNNYDVVVASKAWARGNFNTNSVIALWDPGGQSRKNLGDLPIICENSLSTSTTNNVLIIGNLGVNPSTAEDIHKLREFVFHGGHVLMLHPGKALKQIFPDRVNNFTPKDGEIVTMHVPESPIFLDIMPLDLAWFGMGDRRIPLACTGVFQISSNQQGIVALASQCDLHGYLTKPGQITLISGSPLLEINFGNGKVLASEMCCEAAEEDPIARRLLFNAISYLCKK